MLLHILSYQSKESIRNMTDEKPDGQGYPTDKWCPDVFSIKLLINPPGLTTISSLLQSRKPPYGLSNLVTHTAEILTCTY